MTMLPVLNAFVVLFISWRIVVLINMGIKVPASIILPPRLLARSCRGRSVIDLVLGILTLRRCRPASVVLAWEICGFDTRRRASRTKRGSFFLCVELHEKGFPNLDELCLVSWYSLRY